MTGALAISLKSDIITETFYGKYRGNKKTATIVDVDDKNCLAQLTVVPRLNQGSGNGCISLPVCFSLVLSFAQAKERT